MARVILGWIGLGCATVLAAAPWAVPSKAERLCKIPGRMPGVHYCWLDDRTILWAVRGQDGYWQARTTPSSRRHAALLHAVEADIWRSEPDDLWRIGRRYVAVQRGRSYWVHRMDGRPGPEVYGYHTDIVWSPDGSRYVDAYWGTNGRILKCAVVGLRSGTGLSVSVSLDNPKNAPLFADGMVAAGMSSDTIYVLRSPCWIEYGLRDNLTTAWLVSRRIGDGSARVRRRVIRLPGAGMPAYEGALFSSDARRFALVVRSNSSAKESLLCVGDTRTGHVRTILRFRRRTSLHDLRLGWKPDGRSLSFIEGEHLCVVPV